MRITQGIVHRNFLRNLERITDNINHEFQQISSGKRIIRASDDPVSVQSALKFKDRLNRIEEYERNIDNAISWLNMVESAFNAMEDILNRLEEIAVSMGSDNVNASARKIAAQEVSRIKEHALMIANTKFKGRYIFSGFKTDTPPFTDSDNNYHGDNGIMQVEVDDGLKISYNFTGDIFTDQVNIFQLMDDLKDALNKNDSSQIRALLDDIHQAYERVNIAHAELGAKVKTLENMKQDLSSRKLSFNEFISKREDLDLAEAIPKLYIYQSGYQAILHSFSKITSINLFDIIG